MSVSTYLLMSKFLGFTEFSYLSILFEIGDLASNIVVSAFTGRSPTSDRSI